MRCALPIALVLGACDGCDDGSVKPAAVSPVATCIVADGDVRTRPAQGVTWGALEPSRRLLQGDWIQTGKSSYAVVEFDQGGKLDVTEESAVVIERSGVDAHTLRVMSGVVRGVVQRAKAGQLILLSVPGGETIEMKSSDETGTLAYRVTARDDGVIELAVTEGSVEVQGPEGPILLVAGHALDFRNAMPVSRPEPLPGLPELIAPGVDAVVGLRDDLVLRFAWAPDESSARYRIDVTNDQSFKNSVFRTETNAVEAKYRPQVVGPLYWRVAGINANGRVGEYGFARRVYVSQHPSRDLLIAPMADQTVTFVKKIPSVSFSWQAVVPPTGYRLVIAKHADLAEQVVKVVRTEQQQVVEPLEAGVYHWGVFAEQKDAPVPLFTRSRKLTVLQRRDIKAQVTWE